MIFARIWNPPRTAFRAATGFVPKYVKPFSSQKWSRAQEHNYTGSLYMEARIARVVESLHDTHTRNIVGNVAKAPIAIPTLPTVQRSFASTLPD